MSDLQKRIIEELHVSPEINVEEETVSPSIL